MSTGETAEKTERPRRWLPWLLAAIALGFYIGSILYIVYVRGEV